MDTKEIMKSKKFKTATIIVGGILVALVIFAVGVGVGLRKARFSYRFGENYERNFGGPMMRGGGPMGFFREMEGRDFRNGHGLSGDVISIADNNLVIKDRDGKENTAAVSDRTIIKLGRDDLKLSDIKIADHVVVIGKPGDSGVVNADLIRVFDNNFSK